MKRLTLAAALAVLMLVPIASAGANGCPSLEGRALLDWGASQTGIAQLSYDGRHINVPFTETFHDGITSDFTFHFPAGDVYVTETAVVTPLGGPLYAFDSDIAVNGGGTGYWEWSGISNNASGRAQIATISGELCIG